MYVHIGISRLSGGYVIGDIDQATVRVNDNVVPDSCIVVPATDSTDEMLSVVLKAENLISCYNILSDTMVLNCKIEWEYNDFAAEEANGRFKMIVHLPGDVGNDGRMNLMDIIYLINYIYKEGPFPVPHQMVGDIDCSGGIDILDIMYLINYLYKGGPAPNCL